MFPPHILKPDPLSDRSATEARLCQYRDPKSKFPQSFTHELLPPAQRGKNALPILASLLDLYEEPFGINLGFAHIGGFAYLLLSDIVTLERRSPAVGLRRCQKARRTLELPERTTAFVRTQRPMFAK